MSEVKGEVGRCHVLISGASGRLGSAILRLATADPLCVVSQLDTRKKPQQLPDCDVVVDVSHPEVTAWLLGTCLRQKIPLLIGTTGLSSQMVDQVEEVSKLIPIAHVSNFSLGALVLERLAIEASRWLKGYEITIREHHHVGKRDAPSGTAISLRSAIQAAGGTVIDVESHRQGDIVGVHEASWRNEAELVTLGHEVFDRDVFARGALTAAQGLSMKKPGRYSLADLIDLPAGD
jgi:4-hydroxy-tetrahydrodipicolinate reductase